MSTLLRTLPALAVFALVAAVPAQAQDARTGPSPIDLNGDSVTIGGGGAYLPDYEGSNDYYFQPIPGAIGSVSGYSFTLAGNRASLDLIRNLPDTTWDFQAGPVALLNTNRSSVKGIDDPRIKALGKVGTTIEVGGYLGIGKTGVITSPYDKLSFSVSYRKGVTGGQRGSVIQPTITYVTPLSTKAAIGLLASAEHADRDYGRAYFDVTNAGRLASGLPVYRTQGGWKNWAVGALGTYALTGDLLHGFKVVGGVTYKRMVGNYADSPIVSVAGSKSQWLTMLGLAYTF